MWILTFTNVYSVRQDKAAWPGSELQQPFWAPSRSAAQLSLNTHPSCETRRSSNYLKLIIKVYIALALDNIKAISIYSLDKAAKRALL